MIKQSKEREQRGVILIGFGGMAREYETRVYNYRGFEIRVPRCPARFPPAEVSKEYGCIGAPSWREGVAVIDELG